MIKKLHFLALAFVLSIPLLQAQTGLTAVATPSSCLNNGTITVSYTGTPAPTIWGIAPEPFNPSQIISGSDPLFTDLEPGDYFYGYYTGSTFVKSNTPVRVTSSYSGISPTFVAASTKAIRYTYCSTTVDPLGRIDGALNGGNRPFTVTLRNSGGTVVDTKVTTNTTASFSFTGIATGTYTVQATDACGTVVNGPSISVLDNSPYTDFTLWPANNYPAEYNFEVIYNIPGDPCSGVVSAKILYPSAAVGGTVKSDNTVGGAYTFYGTKEIRYTLEIQNESGGFDVYPDLTNLDIAPRPMPTDLTKWGLIKVATTICGITRTNTVNLANYNNFKQKVFTSLWTDIKDDPANTACLQSGKVLLQVDSWNNGQKVGCAPYTITATENGTTNTQTDVIGMSNGKRFSDILLDMGKHYTIRYTDANGDLAMSYYFRNMTTSSAPSKPAQSNPNDLYINPAQFTPENAANTIQFTAGLSPQNFGKSALVFTGLQTLELPIQITALSGPDAFDNTYATLPTSGYIGVGNNLTPGTYQFRIQDADCFDTVYDVELDSYIDSVTIENLTSAPAAGALCDRYTKSGRVAVSVVGSYLSSSGSNPITYVYGTNIRLYPRIVSGPTGLSNYYGGNPALIGTNSGYNFGFAADLPGDYQVGLSYTYSTTALLPPSQVVPGTAIAAITVAPNFPSFDLSGSGGSICNGNTVGDLTIKVDNAPGTITYFIKKSTDANYPPTGQTNNVFTGLLPGVYQVKAVTSCYEVVQQFRMLSPGSGVGDIIEGTTDYCVGEALQLAVLPLGPLASITWTLPDATTSTDYVLNIPNLGIADSGTYQVTVVTVSGCTFTQSVQVTVKRECTSADLEVEDVLFCKSETVTFTASSTTITNPVFTWYNDPAMTTVVATGPSFTTPALTANRSYFVTVAGEEVCTKNTVGQIVEAQLKPLATAADIDADNVFVCYGQQGTFNASSGTVTNPIFRWYRWTGSGYTLLHTGPSFTPDEVPDATHNWPFIVTVSGDNKCENLVAPRPGSDIKEVSLVGKRPAVASDITGVPDITLCLGMGFEMIAQTWVSGGEITWYADAALTQVLATGDYFSASPVVTTTYYITVESPRVCKNLPAEAKKVVVTVKAVDTPVSQRTVVLCGTSVIVNATAGYDSYVWTNNSTGTTIGNTREITLTAIGSYTVVGTTQCTILTEEITVVPFVGMTTHPIAIFGDETAICPNDLSEMVKIALCGATDSREITISITDVDSISWEQLDEGSCTTSVPDNCPNIGPGCAWTERATGNVFSADTAGQWRITLRYQNGCFQTFYFNVYKNILDPKVQVQDKICSIEGAILVTNVPATGYEFSLDSATGPWTSNPSFTNVTPGVYSVYIKATDVTSNPNQCVFILDAITVRDLVPSITVTPTSPVTCMNRNGSIHIVMTDGAPQYLYELYDGTLRIASSGLLNGPNDYEYTFDNVNPGQYTVKVTLDSGCEFTESVEIVPLVPFVLTATVTRPVTCEPGEITLSVSGGTPPFTYFLNGISSPSPVFELPYSGYYSISANDSAGCVDNDPFLVITAVTPVWTVAGSSVQCFGTATGTILFSVTTDYGFIPEYSIDNGSSYQSASLFIGLNPGTYTAKIRYVVRTETDPFGTIINIYCESPAQPVVIAGPARALTASVNITRDASCDTLTHKAEVRITNPEGGVAPYSYSFDGVNFAASGVGFLDAGTYTVYIKDAVNCSYPMTVVIEAAPATPIFTPVVVSHCDGTSVITVESNSSEFTYTYALDGGAMQVSNVFTNVTPGYHEITTNYIQVSLPHSSILLREDFGAGANTAIPNIDPVYCYEAQTPGGTCGTGSGLEDGEYCVTQMLNPNNPAWVATRDHTGNPGGRFLALNVGVVAGLQGVIYEKQINDIYPGQDLIISFYAMNLLRSTSGGGAPNMLVQLVDGSGTVIQSQDTGDIPKNNIWNRYEVHLNPGTNTQLNFVIRTNSIVTGGNDLALDDIEVYQLPEVCERTFPIPVTVADREFRATVQSTTPISCHGGADGTVTIAVENEGDPVTGDLTYAVSLDNGSTWLSQTGNATLNNFTVGTHTILVKNSHPAGVCSVSLTVTFTEPDELEVTTVVTPKTCSAGGRVVVSTIGGSIPYVYQLTDPDGGTTTGSSTGPTCSFDGLIIPGTYTVTVTDLSNCSTPVTFEITDTVAPVATIDPASDLCFGATGATIIVAVADGVAPFTYRLDGAAPQNSNTFAGLVPGDYTITVTDAYGCTDTVTQTIDAALTANAILTKGLDCTAVTDALITVTLSGGGAGLRYQVSIDGNAYGLETAITGTDFTYTTTTAGSYRFKVSDASGCSSETAIITIDPIVLPEITSVTVTTPIGCHGGKALIRVVIDTAKGQAPFVITVADTVGTPFPDYVSGLPAGNYIVTVTDAKGCSDTAPLTITEPDPITYTITTTPITCDPAGGTLFGIIHIQGVSGGTAPYTYKLYNSIGTEIGVEGPTNTPNFDFTVVDFGFYRVEVIDANDCLLETRNIPVASPPESLDIEVVSGPFDCVTGASVKVTVGGSLLGGPFEFAIITDPAQRYPTGFFPSDAADGLSYTFTGLIPGVTYSFAVYDTATGCHYFKQAESPIPPYSNLISVMDPKNVTCKDAADGSISFTFSDYHNTTTTVGYQVHSAFSNLPIGVPGETNGLTPGQTITVTDFKTDLAPGEYYIVFTERGGDPGADQCKLASSPFTISQAAVALSVTATLDKNANCGTDSGIITAVGSGGVAPYEYELLPATSPAPTVGTWAGTPANVMYTDGGDYIVYVKDANNCIQAAPVAITVPTDPTPAITAVVTNQCTGSNGSFTIAVAMTVTGVGPYRYSLDGGTFQNLAAPFTYDNLAAGTHTVTIKDVNDCGIPPVTVEIYAPIVPGIPVTTQPNCTNDDGTLQVNPVGGSGNFEYELRDSIGGILVPFGPANDFTGLSGGTYTVMIRDMMSTCEMPLTVTLQDPIAVTFTATPAAVSCFGGDDGSITVVLAPGNSDAPYQYSKDNGVTWQDTPVFTGLSAGVYQISVKSGKDCREDLEVTVAQPAGVIIPAAAVTVTPFRCTAGNSPNNAFITIDPSQITGGNGTYVSYIFEDAATGTVLQSGTNPVYVVTDINGMQIVIRAYDSNACEGTTIVTVPAYVALQDATVSIVQGITCNNPELVTVNVNGGSGSFTYRLLPLGTPEMTPVFPLATVGMYYFEVTDTATGCSVIASHQVHDFDTMVVTAMAITPVSCLGATDGALRISIAGYTGAYTFRVLDNAGTEVQYGIGHTDVNPLTINDVPGGNHSVEVIAIDTPFCVKPSNTVTIGSPITALQVVLVENASVTCTNDRGVLWANANGGYGTYLYELKDAVTGFVFQNYDSNALFSNLEAGSYLVSVKDSQGCVATDTIVLEQPQPIVVNATADTTVVSCYGDTTATITAIATGGQGMNYQYTLTHAESGQVTGPQSNPVFIGLGAGTYTVTVRDTWTCEATAIPITITQPTALVGVLSETVALGCVREALLTIVGSGGTAPYQYSTDNINFTNNPNFSVPAGTYTYYIQDANGCSSATNTVTILPVPVLDININTSGAVVNCSGEANAIIAATATGGLGSYVYELWNATTNTIIAGPQASGLFNGLGSGNYTIKVISQDCERISAVIVIAEPAPLTIVPTVQSVSCAGQATGSISISATGGTGVIMYAISPNLNQWSTNPEFNNLVAGDYIVGVQDANGCYETLLLTVTEPAALTANVMVETEELCSGSNTGSIRITPGGGVAPYATSLNSDMDGDFVVGKVLYDNLSGGQDYTIYIRDANGCTIARTVSLAASVTLNPTHVMNYSCFNNTPDNELVITVNPAVAADVTFALDGGSYQVANTFTNIAPGNHLYHVKHSNGCEMIMPFTVEFRSPVIATTVVEHLVCGNTPSGKITVNVTAGTGPYEYSISPDLENYSASNIFENLTAGLHVVRIKDSNGCIQVLNVLVNGPAPLVPALVSVLPEVCFGDADGTIVIAVAGGVAPYATSINNGPFVAGQLQFNNLSGGQTHHIVVRDATGCTTDFAVPMVAAVQIVASATVTYGCVGNRQANTVTITVNPEISNEVLYTLNGITQLENVFNNVPAGTHTIEIAHTSGCVQSITVTVIAVEPLIVSAVEEGLNQIRAVAGGGRPGYRYYFNDHDNGTNPVYVFTQSGNYVVKVIDSNGCEAFAIIAVTFIDIEIPNFFTPNADGENDTWTPVKIEHYPKINTDIYDRSGRKVATIRKGQSWDGTYEGSALSSGDYWYVISLNNGTNREIVGHVTIYR